MSYILAVPKNSQVNIRFDDSTDQELEATASKLGISKSALVRHLTRTFLEEVKLSGSLQLKPQWARMLGTADARSAGGERKIVPMNPEAPSKVAQTPADTPQSPPVNATKYPAAKATRKPKKE